jgi:hypothetical protein
MEYTLWSLPNPGFEPKIAVTIWTLYPTKPPKQKTPCESKRTRKRKGARDFKEMGWGMGEGQS